MSRRKKPKYADIMVRVLIPEDATVQDVHDFVVNVIGWAGGCRDPEDPLFESLSVIRSKAKLVKPTDPIVAPFFTVGEPMCVHGNCEEPITRRNISNQGFCEQHYQEDIYTALQQRKDKDGKQG